MGESRMVYDNGFLRVLARDASGRELITVDRVTTQTGCIVVPVTPEGRVVLVREYREGAGCEVIGVVKGAKDHPEERDRDTAERELREELGMSATDIVSTAQEAYALPALTATRGRVVFAYGCRVVDQPQLEANESVSVYAEVDDRMLLQLLQAGVVNDAESAMALQAYLLSRR
jgi:ADP-ribose pyrophosphatase